MKCNCQSLPEFGYYRPRRSLSRRLRPYVERIEKRLKHELFRCTECGTYWRIDRHSFATDRFAWRLPEYRADWNEVSKEAEEKALLLSSRKVSASEPCIWAGCEKKRIEGFVYCVDHLYEQGFRS